MSTKRWEVFSRSVLALVLLLVGVAMAPFVDLPQMHLGWQQFAGVYEGQLDVNYDDGRPGSYFRFTGSNFPPNQTATILRNGEAIGSMMTNGNGQLAFNLSTNQAAAGVYTITAAVGANAAGSDSFTLANNAPLRPLEGDGPIFSLVELIYLPLIIR